MSKDSNQPRISVIIPTRNRAAWLPGCIRSVMAQTYQDLEILIIDDASTDDTADVVASIRSPKVHYVSHQDPRGAAAARNTGLGIARGEFIAFLDDDDQWLPEKLALQIERFDDAVDELGLVYSFSSIVSAASGDTVYSFYSHPGGHAPINFLETVTFTSSVPLIRRSCLAEVGGFDETLPAAQDKDMWIRLSARFSFDCIPEILVRRLMHEGQISSDLKAKISGREQLLEKYSDLLSERPDVLANHVWRLGVLYSVDQRTDDARACFIMAIRHQPRRKGFYKHFVYSLLAPRWHRRHLLRRHIGYVDGVVVYY